MLFVFTLIFIFISTFKDVNKSFIVIVSLSLCVCVCVCVAIFVVFCQENSLLSELFLSSLVNSFGLFCLSQFSTKVSQLYICLCFCSF